ncbi:c-type cytochrome [Variovorax sp. JS1663]|uniref:c-type cytochrome n=1 Tax=Variovorax sp. JS1663 TaxID=1851577 RepID=UPI000B346B61|nr:c-type cytochrome [Variovorax sp. JS1663]OUM01396.1 cytochrome C [Variovorax sp. JS1663]
MTASRLCLWIATMLMTCGTWVHAAQADADMERRVAACITCHGRDGQASRMGYFPRLAGKPAVYLYEQLRSFRDGRRQHAEMSYLLAHLPDAYLREMAEYFSRRHLPYAAPAPTELGAAQLARGELLASRGDPARGIPACVECHGKALTGMAPGIPGLVGLPRLYVASQLGAWLTGDRQALSPDCMAEVGRKLTAADIQAVAGWLATQPVPVDASPASADRPLPVACSAMEVHR